MKTFVDNVGRTWTVAIHVDALKRVRALAQVDLMEAVEGKLLERLTTDPVLLCDVLFALCKPEAQANSVTDEDFGRAMAGDAIEGATTALLEELVDFFPKGRRALLAKALAKMREVESLAQSLAAKRLDDPALLEKVRQALEGPGDSSGTSPASSAATPAA
jgi:hypothetical protein